MISAVRTLFLEEASSQIHGIEPYCRSYFSTLHIYYTVKSNKNQISSNMVSGFSSIAKWPFIIEIGSLYHLTITSIIA